MEKSFNLEKIQALNPMHDEIVQYIDMEERKITFHYRNLRFSEKYKQCDLIFTEVDDLCLRAIVLSKNNMEIEGMRYYDREFLELYRAAELLYRDYNVLSCIQVSCHKGGAGK